MFCFKLFQECITILNLKAIVLVFICIYLLLYTYIFFFKINDIKEEVNGFRRIGVIVLITRDVKH